MVNIFIIYYYTVLLYIERMEQHVAPPELFLLGITKLPTYCPSGAKNRFYCRFAAQIYVLMLRRVLDLYVCRPYLVSCRASLGLNHAAFFVLYPVGVICW
jgi:hypothetical protein